MYFCSGFESETIADIQKKESSLEAQRISKTFFILPPHTTEMVIKVVRVTFSFHVQ